MIVMEFTEMEQDTENKVMPVIKDVLKVWSDLVHFEYGEYSVNESWDHLSRQEYFIKLVAQAGEKIKQVIFRRAYDTNWAIHVRIRKIFMQKYTKSGITGLNVFILSKV